MQGQPGWSQVPKCSLFVCFHATSGTCCHHLDWLPIKAHSLLLAASAVISSNQAALHKLGSLRTKGPGDMKRLPEAVCPGSWGHWGAGTEAEGTWVGGNWLCCVYM